jgi:hypothetical protein
VSRARLAGVVLLLAAAAACPFPTAARAEAVSAAELRSLARQAPDDPAALARLRRIDSVEGRRADVAGALRGARGAALEARLRALAGSVPERPAGAPGDPARDARAVLAQRRFHASQLPGPFRGLINRISRALPSVNLPPRWLDDLIPGGSRVVWSVLAAIFAGIAWFVARRILARRVRAFTEAQDATRPARDDPKALDRRAAAAEAAGDLETALRLRFRAGLLRLDARGAIDFRPSISTHEVRRALRSEDFDALAATFDDVVYGGRPAQEPDVVDARDRWPAVVSSFRYGA